MDHPVSLYAATKKSNELMAYAYSRLYGIPCTGLRFFTVYGPAGRPDMAYFRFTDQLVRGETIRLFNYGACRRDFTYIDDIVEGVVRVLEKPPAPSPGSVPARIYNIGNHHPENLLDFLEILQQELQYARVLPGDFDFHAHTELVPMQPGDVKETYADIDDLIRDFGFRPRTTLRQGLRAFALCTNDTGAAACEGGGPAPQDLPGLFLRRALGTAAQTAASGGKISLFLRDRAHPLSRPGGNLPAFADRP